MDSTDDDPIRRVTRPPEGPGGEIGDGGMTGATGELTPESSQVAFIPAELREASSPDHQTDVTARSNREGAEEGSDRRPPQVPDGESRLGGDLRRDPEEEHF